MFIHRIWEPSISHTMRYFFLHQTRPASTWIWQMASFHLECITLFWLSFNTAMNVKNAVTNSVHFHCCFGKIELFEVRWTFLIGPPNKAIVCCKTITISHTMYYIGASNLEGTNLIYRIKHWIIIQINCGFSLSVIVYLQIPSSHTLWSTLHFLNHSGHTTTHHSSRYYCK